VAIHMRKSFDDIILLFPNTICIEELEKIPATQPFSNDVVEFLNALSQELSKDPKIRNYPDVATFAFFCRKANILQIKKRYVSEETIRLGRGIVFHVTPSNVPVNFAYSLLCGILSGNVNIVRVPSKDFEQVTIICNAITRIASNTVYQNCANRIVIVKYDRNSSATSLFSSFCDVRVIWGGDETIAQIRKSSIPARSFDVTFADRYSLCIINADQYIKEQNHEAVALGFYNDTYLFDQNACTSPHLVVWLGTKEIVYKAKKVFWNKLHNIVKQKYGPIQPIIVVDKLTALYNQAVNSDGVHKTTSNDNLLWLVDIDILSPQIEDFRCSSGYFSEYHANSLLEVATIINRKYQTLAYYGFNKMELSNFVKNNNLPGIDRIVPIGRTTDFSVIWDGFDLIRTLTRCCNIIAK